MAMFQLHNKTKIVLSLEPQDLRKSFNGLEAVVINDHKTPLTDGAIHLFTNKAKTRLKILHSDGSGLWCGTKRLEQGTFSWPKPSQPNQTTLILSPQAFQLIIDGIDLRNGTLRPWYEAK
jgi:transposase